jgi:hypothetical protein
MEYTIGEKTFDKFGWGCYMEAYYEAAELLLRSLPDDQRTINRHRILPTLFLIRHFLELSLKEIITHEEFLFKSLKHEKEHNLEKLWGITKPRIEAFLDNFEKTENKYLFPSKAKIKKLENFILFIHKKDPGSFHFRYPQGTKFDSYLIKKMEVNIRELRESFLENGSFLKNLLPRYVVDPKYYK